MDIRDFELLEQQDFIEAERKELYMRFVEQSNFIYATAKDGEQASKLLERLKSEYFIGYADIKKLDAVKQASDLIDAMQKTYKVTQTGAGLYMEIIDDKE